VGGAVLPLSQRNRYLGSGKERFLTAQADRSLGNEWEEQSRPAPFGMTMRASL
jgi:hypothetical protein